MGEVKLTKAQQAVVDHRHSSLLVSAAAGSGKTKVLVDRMLAMVCDPTDPKNVDDFLIITYTSAAASELRGKIAAAISDRLSEEPENRHLQRQMSRLYLTQISTVHSYCTTLIRTYSNELDVPPDFRVADEQEAELLREESIRRTLDACYEKLSDHPAQAQFLNTLTLGRDDRNAAELVRQMAEYARCHTDPDRWIEAQIRDLQNNDAATLLETAWGRYLLETVRKAVPGIRKQIEHALAVCESHDLLREKFIPKIEPDLQLTDRIAQCRTWEDFHELKNTIKFAPLRGANGEFDEKTLVKTIRDGYKDEINDLLQYFAFDAQQAQLMQHETSVSMIGLLELVKEYRKVYRQIKQSHRVLDFGDLEHYAIRLLVQRGTELPSAIAVRESKRYCQVMVDEYQDTNAVQDLIFRAISQNERNLFMVGDVKQSIYRFRLADPSIFLKRYQAYRNHDEAEVGEACKIMLSENFRSDAEILDAANYVFERTMSPSVGGLYYGESEALRAGIDRPLHDRPEVELYCIDACKRELQNEEEENAGKSEIEASFVANKILSLLREPPSIPDGDGLRSIRPGDIAILLRSANKDGHYFQTALEKVGIPCVTESGRRLFDTLELETVCAILAVVDNPHQDIPLLTAMTGPIFAISNDTIAQIRSRHGKIPLFDAVRKERESFPEIDAFVSTLRELQQQSCILKLHELLRYMDDRLGLRMIFGAMPQGEQRLHNLNQFALLATRFSANGEKSLSQFCARLEKMKNQDIKAAEAARTDAVLIQTIHRSKGLEYPVVILAELSKKFNTSDTRSLVLTHQELGAACDYVDDKMRFRWPSPAKTVLRDRINRDGASETMRVLYVAMTRPKHRLIMTYCASNLAKKIEKLRSELSVLGVERAAERVSCEGDWVLLAAIERDEAKGEFYFPDADEKKAAVNEPIDDTLRPYEKQPFAWKIRYCRRTDPFAADSFTVQTDEQHQPIELPEEETLRQQLRYEYPHLPATVLPTKLTATQLKGRAVDFESADGASPVETKVHFQFDAPDFTAETKGLTPAQRGTATHLAMQFINYAACTDQQAVAEELDRLCQERYLTNQQREAIDPQVIWRFFDSELGRLVLNAKDMVREFKFSIFTDGSLLSADAAGEDILLQGVTDCCIVEEDGLTVLDYKTDRITAGGEQTAAAYYAGQMKAYAMALGKIFERPVKRKILYFFATGTWIEV